MPLPPSSRDRGSSSFRRSRSSSSTLGAGSHGRSCTRSAPRALRSRRSSRSRRDPDLRRRIVWVRRHVLIGQREEGGSMIIVVGGGQAGLAVSHELTAAGLDHTVLERGKVASTWRRRWDTFCLVTPNWTVQLPGGSYDGADPDGYMPRDEIVAHLERYARSFSAPVREGVEVESLTLASDGFILGTSEGELRARTVVLTTGAYQKPHRPKGAEGFSGHVQVIDAEQYRNPDGLARGSVLIVGSGQTGCQLAEELHDSGREVFLACGRAPWVPRRVGGRDIAYWIKETGFFDQPRTALPTPEARLIANQQATGHG